MGKAKGRGRGQQKAKPVAKTMTTRQSPRCHVPKSNSLANPRPNLLSNTRSQPLALVADYQSGQEDDDASSEDSNQSESSVEDSGLDILEFPPEAAAELLFKASVSSTPGLRVVRVRDYEMLDGEETIFEIVYRSGFVMSIPHSEMVLAVDAHNDLVGSEDALIVSQVDSALEEIAVPAYMADRGFRLVNPPVAPLGKGSPPVLGEIANFKDLGEIVPGTTPVEKVSGALESMNVIASSLSGGEKGAKDFGDVVPGTTPVEMVNRELESTKMVERSHNGVEPGDQDLGDSVPGTTPVEKVNGELESTTNVDSSQSGGEPGAKDLAESVPGTTPVEKANGELESPKTIESSFSCGELGAQDLGVSGPGTTPVGNVQPQEVATKYDETSLSRVEPGTNPLGPHVVAKEESGQEMKAGVGVTIGVEVVRKKRKYTKRAKVAVVNTRAPGTCILDEEDDHTWRVQSRRELWQRGHLAVNRPSKIAQEVALVTCNTLQECQKSMRMHGWAILKDMTTVFHPRHRCTQQQRDFIFQYGIDKGLEVVFEDVILNERCDHYVPSYDKDHVNARVQLDTGRKGYQDIRGIYTSLYEEQLRNIICGYDLYEGDVPIPFEEITPAPSAGKRKAPADRTRTTRTKIGEVQGMFSRDSSASEYSNWKCAQTILRGGSNYQHPHSDTARVNSYAGLDIFPFVALHGFGVDKFTLWVGPGLPVRTYGFLHTFDAKNMVFMRGDFVHAGGAGTRQRGHMQFFPLEGAGWRRSRSPWTCTLPAHDNNVEATFLWQLPTSPFGYPSVSSPDFKTGNMIMSYPPYVTFSLRLPYTPKMCKEERLEYRAEPSHVQDTRRKEARRIDAQVW